MANKDNDNEPNDGPAFYDRSDVFDRYRELRGRPWNANDTLEAPVVEQVVGDVRGLRVLDLGCGAGGYGRALLGRGASRYVGLDGSTRMAGLARNTLRGTSGEIIERDLAGATFEANAFDLVVSRLALHYLADLDGVLAAAAHALVPGGRLVYSVEHPVITSCSRAGTGPRRQDWIVDDYFVTGPRQETWLGATFRKYHRTLEDQVAAVQRAGFVLTHLRESRPRRELHPDASEYQRRSRIPLFLVLGGQLPRP
ncbi:MAG: methyltransferase domain-containing protein [Polyangiaceae bacterium]